MICFGSEKIGEVSEKAKGDDVDAFVISRTQNSTIELYWRWG
jgi:hypothetical protein